MGEGASGALGWHLSPATDPAPEPQDGRLGGLGAWPRGPVGSGKSELSPSGVQVPGPLLPRCVALGGLLRVFMHPFPSPEKETHVDRVPDPLEGLNYYSCESRLTSVVVFPPPRA